MQFAVLLYMRVSLIWLRLVADVYVTACCGDTYHMTVSTRPKSSVRLHTVRKLRPVANFVPTTEFFIVLIELKR